MSTIVASRTIIIPVCPLFSLSPFSSGPQNTCLYPLWTRILKTPSTGRRGKAIEPLVSPFFSLRAFVSPGNLMTNQATTLSFVNPIPCALSHLKPFTYLRYGFPSRVREFSGSRPSFFSSFLSDSPLRLHQLSVTTPAKQPLRLRA